MSPQRLKGVIDSVAVMASLKRCPDTNQCFSANCKTGIKNKTVIAALEALRHPNRARDRAFQQPAKECGSGGNCE
jgi:hypothetical protein